MASSTVIAKRSSDTALMPPPPPPKRIKRPAKVIDEDTYTDALTHIIARDFFPGLLEFETQQEYLDALDARDEDWIKKAGDNVRQVMTPLPGGRRARRGVTMTPRREFGADGNTPTGWMGETPASVVSSTTPRRDGHKGSMLDDKDKVDVNMGLTAFQARYTSEDNESFNALLDRQNRKKAEKYSWIWNGNKLPSKRRIAQAASEERRLLQAAPSTSTALIPRPSENQDTRPASIDARPLSALGLRNGFMFDPEDITDTAPQLITRAQAAQEASTAPPKAVNYPNTRLTSWTDPDSTDDTASLNPASPSISAIDAAIRRRGPAPPSTLAGGNNSSAIAGSETPRINGYAFVDEEPTPSEMAAFAPPAAPRDDDVLLAQMIAGATDAGSTPNPFTIKESSRREALLHRMVEKVNAGKRAAAAMVRPVGVAAAAGGGRLAELQGAAGRTPTPKFLSSPRVGGGSGSAIGAATPGRARTALGLTPAARMLYDKVGRTPGGSGPGTRERARLMGAGGAFDVEGTGRKTAWTPARTPVGIKRTS